MGIYEEFTSRGTGNLNCWKKFLKNLCCFNNKFSFKKKFEDEFEAYFNFLSRIIFNFFIFIIFLVCSFLSFFNMKNNQEKDEMLTINNIQNLLEFSNNLEYKTKINFSESSKIFESEFENFILFFSYLNYQNLNIDILYFTLSLLSIFILFFNYLLSNKSRETLIVLNILYIIFIDLFFSSLFFNLNSKNENMLFYVRLIYFFILNTIIYIVYNLDTTAKEVFWLFIYKLIILLTFIFTCKMTSELKFFIIEIGFFVICFIFLSIYVSIRMDYRVRSTEFYLMQKNQNEYYQNLINLINKSFLSLNVTLFKLNFNGAFLNFLKSIGLDDYDIQENINYSKNSESFFKEKENKDKSNREDDKGEKLQTNNTKSFLKKNNDSNSNQKINLKNSNNYYQNSFDGRVIDSNNDANFQSTNVPVFGRNANFKLETMKSTLNYNNINYNTIYSPSTEINKNNSLQKPLFNTNISHIKRDENHKDIKDQIIKKEIIKNFSGSFISNKDNFLLNNISNAKKDIQIGNINQNTKYETILKDKKKKEKSIKMTKIQKRLDRKMRRKRNRALMNDEDIFIQKLDFLLDEVFCCFVKEENENVDKDFSANLNLREKNSLSDTIRDIFYSKNNLNVNSEFQIKGVYTSLPIIKNKIVIELLFRRVQTYEGEVIEFYFNDITEIRVKESEKIKSIFKYQVFPNIIHEITLGYNLIGFIIKNVINLKNKNLEYFKNFENKNKNLNEKKYMSSNNLLQGKSTDFAYADSKIEENQGKINHNYLKDKTNEKNSDSEVEKKEKIQKFEKNKQIEITESLKKNSSTRFFSEKIVPSVVQSQKFIENEKENNPNLENMRLNLITQAEYLNLSIQLYDYFSNLAGEIQNYSFVYDIQNSTYEFDFKPEFAGFDLCETIYFAYDILKIFLSIKGQTDSIKPILELDPNLPQVFYSDQRRIKEILINLIHNSLKFTKKGYIKISAEINLDKDNKELSSFNYVKISVEDTGCGIKGEKLLKIQREFGNKNFFGYSENLKSINLNKGNSDINEEKNEKNDLIPKIPIDKKNPNYEGNGMGLVISKQILDKIGKGITCFSSPNEKTRFSFVLDNKILDSSSNKNYDFLSKKNRDPVILFSKNKLSPMEALNGLSGNLRLKPSDQNIQVSSRSNQKNSDRNIKNVKFPSILNTENYFDENINFVSSTNRKLDFKNSKNKSSNNKTKINSFINPSFSKQNNAVNIKYQNIILNSEDVIKEISSSDDNTILYQKKKFEKIEEKLLNTDFIITTENEKTLIFSPKNINEKFHSVYKLEENSTNDANSTEEKGRRKISRNEFKFQGNIDDNYHSIEKDILIKNKILNDIKNNLNYLDQIFIPLLKILKNKNKNVILVIENDDEKKIFLKIQIKRTLVNEKLKEKNCKKIKVIFVNDGIICLLALFFEKIILQQNSIISIVFSNLTIEGSKLKLNFINCFDFYNIMQGKNMRKFFSENDLKIGLFSNFFSTKNDEEYLGENEKYFKNLHIIKLTNVNEDKNFSNGQYFSEKNLDEEDIEKENKIIESVKFESKEFLKFLLKD